MASIPKFDVISVKSVILYNIYIYILYEKGFI